MSIICTQPRYFCRKATTKRMWLTWINLLKVHSCCIISQTYKQSLTVKLLTTQTQIKSNSKHLDFKLGHKQLQLYTMCSLLHLHTRYFATRQFWWYKVIFSVCVLRTIYILIKITSEQKSMSDSEFHLLSRQCGTISNILTGFRQFRQWLSETAVVLLH